MVKRKTAGIVVLMTLVVWGGWLLGQQDASAARVSDVRNTKHNLSSSGPGTVKAAADGSGGTNQVCVFCHTPHGSQLKDAGNTDLAVGTPTSSPKKSWAAPLWNRKVPVASSYTGYTSSSLDAASIQTALQRQPGGSSKLCLSCHDGTIAIGNVGVYKGAIKNLDSTADDITMSGTGTGGVMPDGTQGKNTGYTRNLGVDLRNDHPISITLNSTLITADGEMRALSGTASNQQIGVSGNTAVVGPRPSPNTAKATLPMEYTSGESTPQAQVQCATCHDPHIKETTAFDAGKEKFLRLNRFQTAAPTGTYSQTNDIICLACHDKDKGLSWKNSAHAVTGGAYDNYTYVDAAATLRDFPTGIKVWQAACLNCHDPHTVAGSRRLLREGVSGTLANFSAGGYMAGNAGTSALENYSESQNTCFQCHGPNTMINNATLTATSGIPDIATEFNRSVRMPIVTANQGGGTAVSPGTLEKHDIRNADFQECRANLGDTITAELATASAGLGTTVCPTPGTNTNSNRHVECTDCHNPHRVIRNALFTGGGATDRRTHVPAAGTNGADGNVASGVLRGQWGVEPTYTGVTKHTFPTAPDSSTGFAIKKGDCGASCTTTKTNSYLTREYQLCFKCHSNYSSATFANLGHTGGSASGTFNNGTRSGLTKYTNIAAEFSANANDSGTGTDQRECNGTGQEPGATNGSPPKSGTGEGGCINHRSWHPVIWPTGRTKAERGNANFNNIREPFRTYVGTQTMHCSDCHGSEVSWTQGTDHDDVNNKPDLTKVQGPHGSGYEFLLKGTWRNYEKNSSNANRSVPSTVSLGNSSNSICGRCHTPAKSAGSTRTISGFSGGGTEGSHDWSPKSNWRCTTCHVVIPHGWKNKAFLVNLYCVGSEAGLGAACNSAPAGAGANQYANVTGYTQEPYYYMALLRINQWAISGDWQETRCGDGTGKDWMSSACSY